MLLTQLQDYTRYLVKKIGVRSIIKHAFTGLINITTGAIEVRIAGEVRGHTGFSS